MAYYLVLNFDVQDEAKFREYQRRAGATAPADMKVLAVDTSGTDLEGKSGRWLLIVEFPSEERAMEWYRSTPYQAAAELRRSATTGWLRGVPGFNRG